VDQPVRPREGYPTTGEYQHRTSGDDTPHSQRVE